MATGDGEMANAVMAKGDRGAKVNCNGQRQWTRATGKHSQQSAMGKTDD